MAACAGLLEWLVLAVVLTGCLVSPARLAAQSLTASGGASTFLEASGFQLDYRWAPVSGWVGTGLNEGFHLGGFLGTTYRGTDLGIGDRYYPFVLDTDVLDRSYYFNGRGLSVSRRSDNQKWMLFAGATAREFSTPFLRSFETGDATGAFFYERKFRPRVTVHSWNIFRSEVTSIQSVGITLKPHWKVDAAGGVGANSGFFSAATEYEYKWLDVTASYTAAGDRFRRMRISAPLSSERRGANVRLRISPLSNLHLELNHGNVLSPTLGAENPLRASLDSANVSTSLMGFGVSGGFSKSQGGAFVTRTQLLSVSRRLGSRLTGFGALLRIRSEGTKPVSVFLTTAEEKISPRLSVRQTVTRTSSNTSLSWGGRFLSNPLSLGIDYQTVFTPLAGGFNGRQFVQAWMVSVQLRLPRGIQLHYDTFVSPFGRTRYTAYASGIRYSREEEIPSGPATIPISMAKYVVRGVVQDEKGKAVWGIALHINGQFVYSDTLGQFFLRVKKRGEYVLTVVPEQSLNPGLWETVSAPSHAFAEPESTAKQVVIVLRRRGASGPRTPATPPH